MGRFLRSGRGRFALLLVVVGASSLAIMGSSCAPAPTKQQPPASTQPPTGLSIDPTSWDFGGGPTFVPKSFTVTNNGPDTSGTLAVQTVADDHGDFVVADPGADNTCTGKTLANGETCTVAVSFVGSGAANGRLTTLVVNSDKPADGEAHAALTGTVPE